MFISLYSFMDMRKENNDNDVSEKKPQNTKAAPPVSISSSEDEDKAVDPDEDDNAGSPVPSN